MSKRNLKGIEYFRIAAAFLVVAIHTSPLASCSATADFIVTRVIARVAVPFFFMATGYFVLGGVNVRRSLKKLLIIYAASAALYLPVNVYAGHLQGWDLLELARQALFEGTFYHLWYLPAAILGLWLTDLLLRRLGEKRAGIAVIVLYALGLLGDSYWGLIENVPGLSALYGGIFALMGYTRNGLFFAPMFFYLGSRLQGGKKRAMGYELVGLIAGFAVMLAEALFARSRGWQRHDSMYVFLPFVVCFLFALLMRARGSVRLPLGNFSLLVYILHPAVIIAVRGAARALGLWGPLVENSLGHYIAVCLGSAAASAAILWLWERIKPRRVSDTARAWVEVDLAALKNNARRLSEFAPEGCELMAVLKCDAYGHGAVRSALELNGIGVRAFAVACCAEGVELRRAGVRGLILILGWTPVSEWRTLRRYHLTQCAADAAYARELSGAARGRVDVHVKVDTGMHRLGEDWSHADAVAGIYALPNLRVTGMFTHLAVSDSLSESDADFTSEQIRRFFALADELKSRGIDPGALHTQASYGLLNYPDARCAYARAGVALYGVKSDGHDGVRAWPGLTPALSLKARIGLVRELPAGESVGYGREFTTARESRIAVLPIGYGDGVFRCAMHGGAEALVNGKRCPVVARICMDQLCLDVTDAGEVKPGDIATFIGRDGDELISCEEFAAKSGTISNEVLSRLGKRLPRVYR